MLGCLLRYLGSLKCPAILQLSAIGSHTYQTTSIRANYQILVVNAKQNETALTPDTLTPSTFSVSSLLPPIQNIKSSWVITIYLISTWDIGKVTKGTCDVEKTRQAGSPQGSPAWDHPTTWEKTISSLKNSEWHRILKPTYLWWIYLLHASKLHHQDNSKSAPKEANYIFSSLYLWSQIE